MAKYKMLRTLSLTMRLLGWLVFLGGIALSGVIMAMPDILVTYGFQTIGTPVMSALGILFMSIVYAIIFLGVSEFVLLAISVDDNTRKLKDFFTDKSK
ncbi:MAG: hypothetical protein PHR51_00940 [Patescibacteria group bacterium]|nr:hypothetical protein [Patescibacteria group bacterium]